MQSPTKRRTRGRPPVFKPGDLSPFLERKVLEIEQEVARLTAARDTIIKAAKDARAASARRS